jgi:hypothetical protein
MPPTQVPQQPQPQQPQPQPQPEAQPQPESPSDALAQAPTAGSEAPETFNAQMIGDLAVGRTFTTIVPNGFATFPLVIPQPPVITTVQTVTQVPPSITQVPGSQPPVFVQVPNPPIITTTQVVTPQPPILSSFRVPLTRTLHLAAIGPGPFKVGENESPLPEDRFFVTYNYYNNVGTADVSRFDVHREVAGFETSFLDGDASIGLRLPFLQQPGSEVGRDDFGDLSVLFKFAFLNDRETGNVLSSGLVVTAPTAGRHLTNFAGTHETTLLQPFGAYIFNMDRLYVHGFSSFIFPADSSDPTLMSNDVGVGYRLIQNDGDAMFRYVIPTVEGHLTTALSKRGLDRLPVGFPDTFVLTTGIHLGLSGRGRLTLAVGTPMTGPRTFDVEGIVQFNYRF